MEAKNASLWNIFNAEKYVLKIQKHSEIKQLDSSNRVQKWEPDNVPARKYYQKQCLSVGGARHVAVQKSAHHVSNWGRTTPALMQPSIASLVSFRLHHISSYRPDHYLNFNLFVIWRQPCGATSIFDGFIRWDFLMVSDGWMTVVKLNQIGWWLFSDVSDWLIIGFNAGLYLIGIG